MRYEFTYSKLGYSSVPDIGPTISPGDIVITKNSKGATLGVYTAVRSVSNSTSSCDYCSLGRRRCQHYYFSCPNVTLKSIDNMLEDL